MVSSKLLFALCAVSSAFLLVIFTAIKLAQPLSQTDGVSQTKLKFTHNLQKTYEATQSALIKLVDNPYLLPYPGILPNHPFYWSKMVRDRVQLVTTSDPTQKMRLLLLFADKRLAAGQLLIVTGDDVLGISTLTKAEKYLLQAYEIYRNYDAPEKERYRQYIGDALNRHLTYVAVAKSQADPSIKTDSLVQLSDSIRTIYEMEFKQKTEAEETSLPIQNASIPATAK